MNCVGYHIDQDPAPIMVVMPTERDAETWSKDRLSPMARDTSCLTGKIADPKSRDGNNKILHKRFSGGHLTIVGAMTAALALGEALGVPPLAMAELLSVIEAVMVARLNEQMAAPGGGAFSPTLSGST